jgi:hypothetical protein
LQIIRTFQKFRNKLVNFEGFCRSELFSKKFKTKNKFSCDKPWLAFLGQIKLFYEINFIAKVSLMYFENNKKNEKFLILFVFHSFMYLSFVKFKRYLFSTIY